MPFSATTNTQVIHNNFIGDPIFTWLKNVSSSGPYQTIFLSSNPEEVLKKWLQLFDFPPIYPLTKKLTKKYFFRRRGSLELVSHHPWLPVTPFFCWILWSQIKKKIAKNKSDWNNFSTSDIWKFYWKGFRTTCFQSTLRANLNYLNRALKRGRIWDCNRTLLVIHTIENLIKSNKIRKYNYIHTCGMTSFFLTIISNWIFFIVYCFLCFSLCIWRMQENIFWAYILKQRI